MVEWIPVLAGLVLIGGLVTIGTRWRRTRLGRELALPIGLRPTGPGGTLTRGDHFRRAGFAGLVVAPMLVGAAALGMTMGAGLERWESASQLATMVAFVCAVLAATSLLAGLIAFIRGVFYRPGRAQAGHSVVRIHGDAFGVRLFHADRESAAVQWDRVTHVVVFKRDLITIDEIYLALCFADDDGRSMWLELSEEWYGFEELAAALPDLLPGVRLGWYQRQVGSAFSTGPEVLFRRVTDPWAG